MVAREHFRLGCALFFSIGFGFLPGRLAAQTPINSFDGEVKALQSRLVGCPRDPIIFYGSSSIRLWKTLQADFPGYAVLNCGFGGSRLADCVKFAPLLVLPLKPSAIIIYAGDNDLSVGTAPEKVFDSFQQLFILLRNDLPGTPIAFVSVKPSPARAKYLNSILRFNELVDVYMDKKPGCEFIDVCSDMLGNNKQPNPSLFVADQIHLNPAGYQIMRKDIGNFLRDEFPHGMTAHR
jgi:lysophospholipase L1-like esterase